MAIWLRSPYDPAIFMEIQLLGFLDSHGTQPEMSVFSMWFSLPCPFEGTIFMFYLKLARCTFC